MLTACRAAARWGVPPTVLLDRSRAAAAGWVDRDVKLALALQVHEEGLCEGCGHPLVESASVDADPDNPAGTHRYDVGPPVRCHACTAIARGSEPYVSPEDPTAGSPYPQALRFAAARTPRPHRR